LAKYWKLAKGKWAFITPSGKRGIASNREDAKAMANLATPKKKSSSSKRGVSKSTPSRGKKGGGRKVAKKKSSRKKRSFTIPLGATVGATAGLFMPHYYANDGVGPIQRFLEGNYTDGFHRLAMNYVGVDTYGNTPNDVFSMLMRARGLHAAIAGGIVSWIASKLGINRRLGRAGVPFIRI